MNNNLTLALFLTVPLLAQAEDRFISLQLTGNEAVISTIALQASFDVIVTGLIARTRLTQRFVNQLDQWAEARYVLPLPDGAAVDRLQILVGDTVIAGAVVEKVKAQTMYQHARRDGRRAAVVHLRQPNVFEMFVANIPPGEEVGVVVEFQQIVTLQDGRYRLRLPTTLTPQYAPSSSDARAVASHRVSDTTLENSHRLEVTVDLAPGFQVAEIVSTSHSIEVREASDHHRIELGPSARMDRDFLLEWLPTQVGDIEPTPFIESFDAHYYTATLIAAPEMFQIQAERTRELILVLDRSGSMAGAPMRQAKHAITHAIEQLNPNDRFNVVLFSDRANTLFDRPHLADAHAKSQALTLLDSVEASGGTEMKSALEAALWQPRSGSGLRQIMFVTDGAVANVDALGDFIARNLGNARLFTVGIGNSPNAYFMRRAAEQGRGSYTFIADLGSLEDKMRSLFDRIDRPALTDIEIRYFDRMGNEVEAHAFPAKTPDVYAGDSVMLLARFQVAPIAAQISGRIGDTFWRQDLDIRPRARSGLRVSWARRKLEALEHAQRRARGEADKLELARRIVDLAIHHQLTSRFTSLVAVDPRPARAQLEPSTSGWIANLAPSGTRFATARTGSGWLMLVLAGFVCLLLAINLKRFSAVIAPSLFR